MSYELLTGDCRDVLAGMAADSADAVICDPPYALTSGNGTTGFMGRDWDHGGAAFDPATWAAILKVARPGAWLLAFGGTRTWHRLVCAIEDGGWRISDQIANFGAEETVGPLAWCYGSGFPKGKSQLKPAWEPICVARKPAARVAPLNIEACRVTTGDDLNGGAYSGTLRQRDEYTATDAAPGAVPLSRLNRGAGEYRQPAGRWPPNLLLSHDERCVPSGVRRVKGTGTRREQPAFNSATGRTYQMKTGTGRNGMISGTPPDPDGYETVANTSGCVEGCPVRRLDEQAAGMRAGKPSRTGTAFVGGMFGIENPTPVHYDETGPQVPSRFFPTFRYCSKAPPRERMLPDGTRCPHPTVKPEKLVSWLCSLVASPGMTILDPFMGSGTTGVCALRHGCDFVGIEQEPEYADYARQRLDAVRPTLDTAQEEIHA